MPFARTSLPDLIARTTTDLVSRLEIASAVLRRAVVRVLPRVWSGAVHEVHGHLEWNSRQLLAATADESELPRHGAEMAVTRLSGSKADGPLTVTGTNGAVIPAGRLWQRADGLQYEVEAEATIVGGTATVSLVCTTSGAAGNAAEGVALALVSPIPGIVSSASVAAGGITGGVDQESVERWRQRILERKRQSPQGGSKADYIRWAKEVPGVTRVWVLPQWLGAGTVGVTFVQDDEVNIIPDAGMVDDVQDYIDAADRRPVTAEVIVFAPAPLVVNFSIELVPNTAPVRAAVQAELADLLRRYAEPGKVIPRSKLSEAISIAEGEDSHEMTVPAGDIAPAAGQLPVMGVVTWL
jgi:uncharacterized phage protein gp47/JayE